MTRPSNGKGTLTVSRTSADLRFPTPTGYVSHKPSSRLPLLSVKHAVTFPASECHLPWTVPIYTVCMCVIDLPRVVAWRRNGYKWNLQASDPTRPKVLTCDPWPVTRLQLCRINSFSSGSTTWSKVPDIPSPPHSNPSPKRSLWELAVVFLVKKNRNRLLCI